MSGGSPLNPAVPTRKRSSLRRFSLWAGLVLVALFVGRFIVGIGQSVFWFTSFSHSRVYQNQTLEEVKNRGTVVRPLIDENQSFDIAVSIWSLPVEQHGERIEDVAEVLLYSDIVFRGLRLADKHNQTIVTYRLPVTVFKRLLLKENDLRASFVAIPTSPSLVDYVSNFSTWRPETMRVPPVRSWPFPLGTSNNGPQNVADRALDSFGLSMPLLEFHEIRSKCTNDSESTISRDSGQHVEDKDKDADDDDDYDEPEEIDGRGHDISVVSDMTKYPQHAVKRHPFVVTRTQIRIVDEVHIFNRKAYNKEHNKLKSVSCGQGMNANPDHHLCHRTYLENGNWETRLELRVPDKATGELRTEWAYAPYINYGSFSSGPKDLIPVPVTREKCMQSKNTPSTADPDFIEIDWQLSYTGRTPPKFFMTEMFPRPQRVKHHDSEYKKTKAHDTAELWNGLYGHRFYEDAHPRRRAIIGVLASIVSFVLAVLDIGYWYTRTSTAFISVSGTVLIALGGILSAFAHIANAAEDEKLDMSSSHFLRWFWLIVLTLVTELSLPFFMLKAVTRLEVNRNASSWLPSVRLVGPTHKERNSQRLDSRTGWAAKAGVCMSMIAVYYLFSPDEYHVISAHLPNPTPDDHPANSVARIYALVFFPLQFTGTLSQLLLNQRSKTFAGCYKMAVVLRCILMMLALIVYSPSVVGRFDARPGFSAPQAVTMITLAATVWQAATLPKAIQQMEDEDNE
ncbi:hypothetical protein FB451DRAFT_1251471 [Mycena latifolia]|nr:hypothetical protein FB451DRAFT_1251471 [Mycena latifolia]